MSKFTVLHLIDTTGPGGAEDVFISLATRLNGDDFRSIAVIRGEGYVADTLRENGVEPIIIDAKGSFNFSLLKGLNGLIKRERVDLIQSHLLGSNVYAAIVGWLTRTPVVATYHGMVDISPNERFRKAKLWFMRKGISHFVSVSNALKNAIDKNQLLVSSKTSIVYNGIDTKLYDLSKDSKLKAQLGIEASVPLIGALGNVRSAKRYDLLVEAAAIVKNRGHNVAFCIAGDPKASLKEKLDQLIDEKGLSNIHFVGFVKDTPEYLQNIDAFILTSDAEGFSISTIEAMASGLPVIATKCGGPEEIIENQFQGTLVNISAVEIADAVESFVDSFSATNHLVNYEAQKRVIDAFSIEVMLNKYLMIYKKLSKRFPEKKMESSL